MKIGRNISDIRKKKNMTLSELAERANISKSYLSNLERSSNGNPSIHIVEKIAEVLHVDVSTLLGEEKESLVSEKEWNDFVYELKKLGIDRPRLEEYKVLFEFIRWKNKQSCQGIGDYDGMPNQIQGMESNNEKNLNRD